MVTTGQPDVSANTCSHCGKSPVLLAGMLCKGCMARIGDGSTLLECSFCGKSQKQVKKMITAAGQGANICNECVDLCSEICEEEPAEVSTDG